MEALAAALAMLVRRPVKVALTMEEQFYVITKHPTTFRIKSGVTNGGKVLARTCDVLWNGGAYADASVHRRATRRSQLHGAEARPDIDNISIDSYALYTSRTPAGAVAAAHLVFRKWSGPAGRAICWRAKIGMDPVEFRRKNILREGRERRRPARR